jgi:hypothetical protein
MTHQLSQPEIGYIDESRTSKSDDTSHIPDNIYGAFKSQQNLDAFLLANGYTAITIRHLTTNDKIYAVREINIKGAMPVISTLAPVSGPAAGGTSVAIVGSGFTGVTGAASVKFGNLNATSYAVSSDSLILAVAPAAPAGAVSVTITTPKGKIANKINGYTYV